MIDFNNCRHVPILRARGGETKAVAKLFEAQREKVLPLFDLFDPKPGSGRSSVPNWLAEYESPHKELINRRLSDLSKLKMPIIVDCFNFDLDDELAPDCLAYQHIFQNVISSQNELIPCIGYDRWSDETYSSFIQQQMLKNVPLVSALRIDRAAMGDLGTDHHFSSILSEIVHTTGLNASTSIAILDLGDLAEIDIIDAADTVVEMVRICREHGFGLISVGGSSFPDSVNKAVPEHWSAANVCRLEKELLLDIIATCGVRRLALTDYGVRNPRSHEGGGSNANGKIRYTTADGHHTVRGTWLFPDKRTGRPGYGFKQMYQLASEVVSLNCFPGAVFSWGDAEIEKRARIHKNPGNLESWIAFDTNRHICFVISEIDSLFEKQDLVITAEDISFSG